MSKKYVLAINPGSTSTKVAIFRGDENILQTNLDHDVEELDRFKKISDQFEYRKDIVERWLIKEGYEPSQFKAVVGRGGLLRPMPGGTYLVTDTMMEDLKIGVQGEHASNLGGLIARSLADKAGIDAYIVDPVSIDEFEDVARISGISHINRRSLVHALNIKAVAHNVANEMKRNYHDVRMVIAHLGGGISISPLKDGKLIDANNANEMGPFSPERTGGLPVGDVVKLCFSGKYTFAEMKKKVNGKGGLAAYFGTKDARVVEKMVEEGDEKAKLVFDAMAYQISKEIGAMSTVLEGKVDAIVLTGGLAYSEKLTNFIKESVGFIAPVIIQAGEDEMWALNEGVTRVLNGEEQPKIYENEVK